MDHGGHCVRDIPLLISATNPDAAYTGAIAAPPGFAEIVLDAAQVAARAETHAAAPAAIRPGGGATATLQIIIINNIIPSAGSWPIIPRGRRR
jgi:hypothetical protein